MKALVFIALAAGLCPAAFSADSSAPPDPTQTVPRALGYLVEKGIDWTEDQTCATCHHLPMMIWSLREAKAAGFSIDEKALAKGIEWTLSPKVNAKTFPAETKNPDRDIVSLAAVHVAFALAGTDAAPPEWWAQQSDDALRYQQPEGGWLRLKQGRPPLLSNEPTHTTLFAANALAVQPLRQTDPKIAAALDKALAWLSAQPAEESTQYHAMRLLLDTRLGRAPDEVKQSIEWLWANQNENGGWAQAADQPTDAYATGQAVYTLIFAGIARDDPAIQRAREFLAKTQTANGSWPMISRPTATSTKGADNLEPITYSATAWATLALACSQPR